jgi:integrase/recombinase XerD
MIKMIKRRVREAAVPYSTGCHNPSGDWDQRLPAGRDTLEYAQQIAAYQSPRTTKLYDRTKDQISLDEVERIKF